MAIAYPIFAFEKDDQSMRLIESEDRILYWHEAIDIENGEHLFWDANGDGVEIDASVGAFKNKLESVLPGSASLSINEAFKKYAESLGIFKSEFVGPPIEIWSHIQREIQGRSDRKKNRGTD